MSLHTDYESDDVATKALTGVIRFGSMLAIAISWTANKSILWAIAHGVFSWGYVIYWALK